MKTTTIVFALSLIMGLALGGCSNTFNGVGRDTENAGKYIQRQF